MAIEKFPISTLKKRLTNCWIIQCALKMPTNWTKILLIGNNLNLLKTNLVGQEWRKCKKYSAELTMLSSSKTCMDYCDDFFFVPSSWAHANVPSSIK